METLVSEVLRVWFAGLAFHAFLSQGKMKPEDAASNARAAADAMLDALRLPKA